ncbi:hypothetical protein [Blastococcus sp. PRF04-17]|uniref:hypothetical protein n=1 Tax=Blastococcus sp. PRF04-17 TaxID=2933797 RepID=UPI001FF6A672|nr:hypothetical protein [Blastococcus sp. PRF04-17]UOY03493.1 hypothetical protein MVA48_09275 [Blastococcus sp. PRF04-17]
MSASLWRARGMQALIGVTVLGFASYCLTLASLPVYAVRGEPPRARRGSSPRCSWSRPSPSS